MAISRSTYASMILFMELLAFLSDVSAESAEKDTTSLLSHHVSSKNRVIVAKWSATVTSFVALMTALPPFFQAAAAAGGWRSLLHLAFSYATVYCASAEFSTNLLGTKLLLPHELVPVCLAALVVILIKLDENLWGPPPSSIVAAAAEESKEDFIEIKSS